MGVLTRSPACSRPFPGVNLAKPHPGQWQRVNAATATRVVLVRRPQNHRSWKWTMNKAGESVLGEVMAASSWGLQAPATCQAFAVILMSNPRGRHCPHSRV